VGRAAPARSTRRSDGLRRTALAGREDQAPTSRCERLASRDRSTSARGDATSLVKQTDQCAPSATYDVERISPAHHSRAVVKTALRRSQWLIRPLYDGDGSRSRIGRRSPDGFSGALRASDPACAGPAVVPHWSRERPREGTNHWVTSSSHSGAEAAGQRPFSGVAAGRAACPI
jgi:hypothetical protein